MKLLSSMDDAEFAAFCAQARGVDGSAIAETLRNAEYTELQKQATKDQAAQALRTYNSGGH
jgi:hypothetical protein